MLQNRLDASDKFASSPQNFYLISGKIINCFFCGDQNSSTVKKFSSEIGVVISNLKKENKKALILVDISRIGKTPVSARQTSVDILKRCEFDKIAIIGTNMFLYSIVNCIIKATGRGFQIRIFRILSDAKDWLLIK
jgi:hypothetical protein